ncbi:TPA: hypothetical protein HA361_02285 [Candidatus Woesearchaeota archaeon]|nr:hypothetical protein [Candidatus Woesearchaeota archaeon]HII68712.1 hypothetical protein [Candidatus Woesearchaeota archaeon]
MGLEEVKRDIMESAKAKATRLRAEVEEERQRLEHLAKERVAAFAEILKKREESAADLLKKTTIAKARAEAKRMLLEKKQERIDAAFADAEKELARLPAKTSEEFLRALLAKAGAAGDVAVIYCNVKDAKSLRDAKIRQHDLLGGFIAENADATVRLDYSYESILASVREKNLPEIAQVLFG